MKNWTNKLRASSGSKIASLKVAMKRRVNTSWVSTDPKKIIILRRKTRWSPRKQRRSLTFTAVKTMPAWMTTTLKTLKRLFSARSQKLRLKTKLLSCLKKSNALRKSPLLSRCSRSWLLLTMTTLRLTIFWSKEAKSLRRQLRNLWSTTVPINWALLFSPSRTVAPKK